tara:strand:- start:3448 stop:4044 length:597 start_codon:yes stop_codon:yes gene_type:complete
MQSTRAKAKKAGDKHYFTGKECAHGHTEKRYACDGACMQCARKKASKQAMANPEKRKALLAKWRGENKEHEKKYREEYAASGMAAIANKRYAEKNKEKKLEATREWRRNNPQKSYETTMRRSKARRLAVPKWFDSESVKCFYTAARMLRDMGFNYHVDHVIPITHNLVCGLHTPDNLQLLPAFDNLSKGNKFNIEGGI